MTNAVHVRNHVFAAQGQYEAAPLFPSVRLAVSSALVRSALVRSARVQVRLLTKTSVDGQVAAPCWLRSSKQNTGRCRQEPEFEHLQQHAAEPRSFTCAQNPQAPSGSPCPAWAKEDQ